MRDEWLRADGPPAQHALAERMQLQAFEDVPYVPLGQQFQQMAHRAEIAGIQPGMPVFWGVQRG